MLFLPTWRWYAMRRLWQLYIKPIEREIEGAMTDNLLEYKAGISLRTGQPVVVSDDTGKLEAAELTTDKVIIGIAARDIAPGEIVQYRHGGNTKDIITKMGWDNPVELSRKGM